MIVLGAGGQVGTALRALRPQAMYLTRQDFDLATASIDEIRDVLAGHDVLVNCAAYTRVDDAEGAEAQATQVNGDAVGLLAGAATELGMAFVTYSSDYVFDGRSTRPYVESDATSPINAYGRSKLVGERLALAAGPRSLVIRTSWVISGTHANFVSTVLSRAAQGTMRVVDDQWGCPTVADDLAHATIEAVEAGVTGILHRTNEGPTTWFRLARAAAEAAGLNPERITPVDTAGYPTPAARPAYSVLGSEVAPEAGLSALPPWPESLRALVETLLRRPPT